MERNIHIWPGAKLKSTRLNISYYFDSSINRLIFTTEAINDKYDLTIHSIKTALVNNEKYIENGSKIIVCCESDLLVKQFHTFLSQWRREKYIDYKNKTMKSAPFWEHIYLNRHHINFVLKASKQDNLIRKYAGILTDKINNENELVGFVDGSSYMNSFSKLNRNIVQKALKV